MYLLVNCSQHGSLVNNVLNNILVLRLLSFGNVMAEIVRVVFHNIKIIIAASKLYTALYHQILLLGYGRFIPQQDL